MVGICLERSPELVISLLAILKAGGTYVPLEASYPEERLQFMLKDTGTQIVITGRKHLKVLGQSQAQLVVVEELMEATWLSSRKRKN